MIKTKREYAAALAEAKRLSEIDKQSLTKEQFNERARLYEEIARYERRGR